MPKKKLFFLCFGIIFILIISNSQLFQKKSKLKEIVEWDGSAKLKEPKIQKKIIEYLKKSVNLVNDPRGYSYVIEDSEPRHTSGPTYAITSFTQRKDKSWKVKLESVPRVADAWSGYIYYFTATGDYIPFSRETFTGGMGE